MNARGRKGKSKAESKIEEAATIGMLAVGLNALFGTLAIPFGEHWLLAEGESLILSDALDKALKTLPGTQYGFIRRYLEQFIPWVGLAIVAGQITLPRIEESQRKRAAARQPEEWPAYVHTPPDPGRPEPKQDGAHDGNAYPFIVNPGAD